MNRSRGLAIFISAVSMLLLGQQSEVQAQLFGNQTIGSSAAQLRSPFGNANASQNARRTPTLGAATGQLGQPGQQGQAGGVGAGLLDGNERFVRGNRSRQDFVGTGRNDLTGFVGAGQALGVGRVPAASDSFRLEAIAAAKVNKPLPKQPAKGMYYPRLVLDLDSESVEANARTGVVAASPDVQRRVKSAGGKDVQVFVDGSTAILKGTVNSRRAAELIVNVLSFEPGIESVDNQITIQ
jgi:hypothetical protein